MAQKAVEAGYNILEGKKPEEATILIPVNRSRAITSAITRAGRARIRSQESESVVQDPQRFFDIP